MHITILGAGAWGSALALSLAPRHDVLLWGRNSAVLSEASRSRILGRTPLPSALRISSDLAEAVAHCSQSEGLLVVATSVAGLRPLAKQLRSLTPANLVWLCKGFELDTLLLPHQIVQQELGEILPCGALSGPSFAQEVSQGLPCALTIASQFPMLSKQVMQAFHGPAMRVYSSDDLIGVEVGGAIKNVMAIATGISDGMGLGLNARAALITRGLTEMARLGQALGGRLETFMGLTGIGDLLLTCTGDLSRNRRVGLALARGESLAEIVSELGHVAEGVPCARAVQDLGKRLQLDMPISAAVAAILFEGGSPEQLVKNLLARDARAETD